MNNNIVDINYNLKTLQLTDNNNENNKEVKIIDRTFINLVRVDVSTQYVGDGIMAQVITYPAGTDTYISLSNMRGFQPSNIYGTFYVSSAAVNTNKQYRALCIDFDYNEFYQIGYTNATDGTILTALPLPCRGVNFVETLEGTYFDGTAFRFYTIDYLHNNAGTDYRIRYTARTNNRAYNNFYNVPKGKKVRLVNIDNMNTQNSVNSTIQLLVFKKQSNQVLSYQILSNQPNQYYILNLMSNNWFYEGDVICYQQQSTSTSTILNTSYEIQNI